MKKGVSIIISSVLIVTSIIMNILFKDKGFELLDFLTGLMFGVGLAFILRLFMKKKQKKD